MAHHQQTNHDRMLAGQAASLHQPRAQTGTKHGVDEDEAGELDEPPDQPLQFSKLSTTGTTNPKTSVGLTISPRYSQPSLLTRALTSPDLTPLSDTEAPVLTSDGGLTSPARTTSPSPPLPATTHMILPIPPHQEISKNKSNMHSTHALTLLDAKGPQETKVEEGLGRKRCISFACSQKKTSESSDRKLEIPAASIQPAQVAEPAPRRPCLLRFACPSKPRRGSSSRESLTEKRHLSPPRMQQPQPQPQETEPSTPTQHRSDTAPITVPRNSPSRPETMASNNQDDRSEEDSVVATSPANRDNPVILGSRPFNRIDFQKSEATRFHEFAGSFTEEDEWTQEQTAYRSKITIDDTLRKENAIRQIGKEAEEEALEEEESYANDVDIADVDESDGGNETDDEEGFADSDDESDVCSDYQFWTPGLTTAATSTDHMEHFRPLSQRTGSESSIESVLNSVSPRATGLQAIPAKHPKGSQTRKGHKGHHATSDMPDSSDFVIGTIDEDQPFEDEYVSRLKRREQLKQKLIPQDIDPSFPNSDPEAENDEDDEVEEPGANEAGHPSKHDSTRSDAAESSSSLDEEGSASENERRPRSNRSHQLPHAQRLRSPPPQGHCLFSRTAHRLRSPPPIHRKISSPPSSRRASPNAGVRDLIQGVTINRLAQRPNLTHTTSLPRTPNPYWSMHRTSSFYGSETSGETTMKEEAATKAVAHGRGPIDIVQGLEGKRQRRKEKFWRQHCRIAHAGKEKERKCQPGKGAQRMREVGLEMADRFKGYKQGAQFVLSI